MQSQKLCKASCSVLTPANLLAQPTRKGKHLLSQLKPEDYTSITLLLWNITVMLGLPKSAQTTEDLWEWCWGRCSLPHLPFTVAPSKYFISYPHIQVDDNAEAIPVTFETRLIPRAGVQQTIMPKGLRYVVYDAITNTDGWIENIIGPDGSNAAVNINIHGQCLEVNGMHIQNDAGGRSITVRMKVELGYTSFDLCIRYGENIKDFVYWTILGGARRQFKL